MSRAKVVSFINYKGGVGKTTSTYHIGCSLAGHHNKRVLLIDIDPQTNLTFLCAPIEKWQQQKKRVGTIATMYERFQNKKAIDTSRFIWRSPIDIYGQYRIEKLDLIPCDIELIGEDLGGGHVSGTFAAMEALKKNAIVFLRERNFIRSIINDVAEKYNYILIDCPPNLYLMTQNALASSDYYCVTAIPDHLSTIGLTILKEKVEKIGKIIKSACTLAGDTRSHMVAQLGGIIFIKVRVGGSILTYAHAAKMSEVQSNLGADLCFSTKTTELIGYSEAAEDSVPIWAHTGTNAKRASRKNEYQDITVEFMQRF